MSFREHLKAVDERHRELDALSDPAKVLQKRVFGFAGQLLRTVFSENGQIAWKELKPESEPEGHVLEKLTASEITEGATQPTTNITSLHRFSWKRLGQRRLPETEVPDQPAIEPGFVNSIATLGTTDTINLNPIEATGTTAPEPQPVEPPHQFAQ